jgi:hypothetical protein
VHEQRRQVAGDGELDLAGHRVVDRVGAGGEVRLALADRLHEHVELLQRLGRRQLQHGERLDGGAQPAHGHGRADAVPGDVADDEGDPGAGQLDRLIPVAADLQRGAGQVAVADLDGGRGGQAGGQHGPLQGQRGGVLPLEPARVVEEDRGAVGELLADRHVIGVEPAEARVPHAAEEPQRVAALRDQRQHQHRTVGEQPGDGLAPPRAGQPAGGGGAERLLEDRLAGRDALHVGRVLRVAQDLPGGERGVPRRVLPVVLDREPAQRVARVRAVLGVLALACQALQDDDLGAVAEVRHQPGDELLRQVAEVQGVVLVQPVERLVQQHLAGDRGVLEAPGGGLGELEDDERGERPVVGLERADGHDRVRDATVGERDPKRRHVVLAALYRVD